MTPRKVYVFTVMRRDFTSEKDKKGEMKLLEIHANVESANASANELAGDAEDDVEEFNNKGDGCDTYKNKTENYELQVKKVELKDSASVNGNGAASAASVVSSTGESTATKKSATKKSTGPSKKTIQLVGAPGSLTGYKFIFTGTLSIDRKTCDATTEAHGGEIVPATKMDEADFVVLGDRPGDKKLADIKEKGFTTLTEVEFIEMLNGHSSKKRKI